MSTYTHTPIKNRQNRNFFRPITIAVLLFAAAAITWLAILSSSLAPSTATTLSEHQTVWESHSAESYSYDLQVMCFCFPDMTRPVTIVVRDGVVESATYVDDGSSADVELFAGYSTVEKLFERLENAQAQDPVVFDVTFNSQYGVPELVSIDIDEMMADEEIAFTVSNFQLLP